MAGRAEHLYSQLQDRAGVLKLIGEPEDSHLDCKQWPANEQDAQKMLAKAASGLTNADGGVLVIGMVAGSVRAGEPDVVTKAEPVLDTSVVRSKVLGIIHDLVEPGILGLEAIEVSDGPSGTTGFVVVLIPKSEGSPRRSRKENKTGFYQRIGSATQHMEYWQIEDMFGKRPHPKLGLHLEEVPTRTFMGADNHLPARSFAFGLVNSGLGIAKFPGIRFKDDIGLKTEIPGLNGLGGFGIPKRPSEDHWFAYRGGVDDVIYPGETRIIGYMYQYAVEVPSTFSHHTPHPGRQWIYNAVTFSCAIYCEGQATISVNHPVPEGRFRQ